VAFPRNHLVLQATRCIFGAPSYGRIARLEMVLNVLSRLSKSGRANLFSKEIAKIVISHGVLRDILADTSRSQPANIIRLHEYGKPELGRPTTG